MTLVARHGGVKKMNPPRLSADATLDLSDLPYDAIFDSLSNASKDDLAFVNRIVPFINITMTTRLPSHIQRQKGHGVTIPTKSFTKMGAVCTYIRDLANPKMVAQFKFEFVRNFLLIQAAYPRHLYEAYVCTNLHTPDAIMLSILNYTLMRLVLRDLSLLATADVNAVFDSMRLVSSPPKPCALEGGQLFSYARRALTVRGCFREPSLAPKGCFHQLSKFVDDSLLCGSLNVELSKVLDGSVLDWLGTKVAHLCLCVPTGMGLADVAMALWTLCVLAATHRPKSQHIWLQWAAAARVCVSGLQLQDKLLELPSSHGHTSRHGTDYLSSSLTTKAVIEQIRQCHAGVVNSLANMLTAGDASLVTAGVVAQIQAAKHIKQPFRFSHICAALIVGVSVWVAHSKQLPSVDLSTFHHKFRLKDGPNLQTYKLIHGCLSPATREHAECETETDDAPEACGRQLKKRRSDTVSSEAVGASLSRWVGDRMVALYGNALAIECKVQNSVKRQTTSYFLSELCVSPTICQAQKYQELCSFVPEPKNLRESA